MLISATCSFIYEGKKEPNQPAQNKGRLLKKLVNWEKPPFLSLAAHKSDYYLICIIKKSLKSDLNETKS